MCTFQLFQSAVRPPAPKKRLTYFSLCNLLFYINAGKTVGTTWMQELAWMVVNQCDFEKSKNLQLGIRSPFLE